MQRADMGKSRQNAINILYILDVLRRYTDETHKLTVTRISALIEKDHGVKIDRKAVSNNLRQFLEHADDFDFGFDVICNDDAVRKNQHGKEEAYYTGWYLERDISDAELRHIIDNLMFSKYLPYEACHRLVKNVKKLSRSRSDTKDSPGLADADDDADDTVENIRFIKTKTVSYPQNEDYFKNIGAINEAISKKRQISFKCVVYGRDKAPTIQQRDGKPWVRTVSPYALVMANARHYLLCSHRKVDGVDAFDEAFSYRVDIMKEIKVLDDKGKRPMNELKGFKNGFSVTKFMSEHIYMYSGPVTQVTFRTDEDFIGTVLDWFGMDAYLGGISDGKLNVTVDVAEDAMFYWLLQFGTRVEVLMPDRLRERVCKALGEMCEKYGVT